MNQSKLLIVSVSSTLVVKCVTLRIFGLVIQNIAWARTNLALILPFNIWSIPISLCFFQASMTSVSMSDYTFVLKTGIRKILSSNVALVNATNNEIPTEDTNMYMRGRGKNINLVLSWQLHMYIRIHWEMLLMNDLPFLFSFSLSVFTL